MFPEISFLKSTRRIWNPEDPHLPSTLDETQNLAPGILPAEGLGLWHPVSENGARGKGVLLGMPQRTHWDGHIPGGQRSGGAAREMPLQARGADNVTFFPDQ